MRLLMITQDFPPDVGGIQSYAFELAGRLVHRCDDFAVLAPKISGSETVDATLPFEVIRVQATYDTLAFKAFPVLLKTAQRRFDTAFHVQWTTAIATLAARPFGGPNRIYVAAHAREILLEPLSNYLNRFYNACRRGVLARADGFLAMSHFTASLLEQAGVNPTNISVTFSGVDPDRFRPQDITAFRKEMGLEKRRIIFSVCRLVPRKGLDTVIRALPRVAEVVPDVLYLIGGNGPDRNRLEALVRQCNVETHVRFVEMIPDEALPLYYNVADVFTMPARATGADVEGFGLVFLEANACETPVIGARTGGIPDAVSDTETGLLVDPDNHEALADSLIRLLNDPEYAQRLGRQGRARILRELTWDHIADRTYAVLAGGS